MIDPLLINTLRVGQLVDAVFSGTDNIPHEVGTDLRRGTINDLATFISGIIQAGDGLAFLPISVTDGQTLQNTTTNEWFLAGVGTYSQNGGYPDIVCTEKLNVIIGNGDYWSLGVAIPIVVDPPAAMISQSINEGVLNFSPSEDAIFNALSLKQNTLTNLITGAGNNNYLPKFTEPATLGDSLIYDNGTNIGIGTTIPNEKLKIQGGGIGISISGTDYYKILPSPTMSYLGLGYFNGDWYPGGIPAMAIGFNGNVLIGTTTDNGVDKLQVNGNIKATSHVTTGGLSSQKVNGDGSLTVGYKVYTALLTQTGTSAPTAIVLENTLGGTVVWGRNVTGVYYATLIGAFTINKTALFVTNRLFNDILRAYSDPEDSNTIYLESSNGDGNLLNNTIEIRVYN